MSLDGTAVQALRASFAQPLQFEQKPGSAAILPAGWTATTKPFSKVGGLALHTLTGLADFVSAGVDELPSKKQILVKDERSVILFGALEGEDVEFRRQSFAWCSADECGFPFGKMLEHEQFVIALQTMFARDPVRDELLALVSKISESQVRESNDDGVGQQVVVQRGVTTVGAVKLPNPVTLKPWRTFREVDQPASLFVLRAKAGGEMPSLGLFEADGGSWKLEAINSIAEWLRKNAALKGIPVIA